MLGKRRTLELVVDEDLGRARMIDGDQADLVQVGDLAQLLDDADLVLAVTRHQRLAGDLDDLVVIDREVLTVACRRAERRDPEHVGDELVLLAVPGVDHRARAG